MRLLVSLLLILVGIVSFGFWLNDSLEASTRELTKQVEGVKHEINHNSWEQAEAKIKKVEANWKDKSKWWPILLDHQEIDGIEFTLVRTKEYVINQDTALAQGQLAELKLMLEHISTKDKIALHNIL